MAAQSGWRMRPAPPGAVTLDGGFWGERIETNRAATIPAVYEQLEKTGRLDALKLAWRPGMTNEPHPFWDSDVAKWLEAACHALVARPDHALRRHVDGVARLIVGAQQADGYLNSYFTQVRPDERWTNLRDMHELYCAGHLIEAAVAHHRATGERGLLDAVCRCADLIGATFGRGTGKRRGYPGHEEIELALVKLYRATGERRYLALSRYFVDERGRRPHYFDREARQRGEDPGDYWAGSYDYCQAHLPVRQQADAEGHAVRAAYLYAAMADLVGETGDAGLRRACRRLWRSATERRMYVTGGIGSSSRGERFTCDYDLPDEAAYAETCAAIGLVFWAHRMLQLTGDGRFADVMERALYNGALGGVSLDGTRFFYANPLAVHPESARFHHPHGEVERVPWFGCACCPPNAARLIASLPGYVWSVSPRTAWLHLHAPSSAELEVAGRAVRLTQKTDYPWRERVRLEVEPERPARFGLALRVPGWCRGAELAVNGEPADLDAHTRKGYAHLRRRWRPGDTVELRLPMPVQRVRVHPKVRSCAGRVALQRGPLVYCLEEADNGPDLASVVLPSGRRLRAVRKRDVLGGVVVVEARALRRGAGRPDADLYTGAAPETEPCALRAVPFYARSNRGPGEMRVWIREA